MSKFKQIIVMALCLVLFAGGAFANGAQDSKEMADEGWKPERPVTVYCWASAGGATDLTSRTMSKAMEEYFGQPFQVVNMTGGSGGIAANHVFSQPRDGYSILGMSESVHSLAVLGAFDKTSAAFDIAMILSSPGVISVPENSPYKTVEELVAAAKKTTLKSGSSAPGSIWTLKLLQFETATGTSFNHLPYGGSHPSQVAALNGEVDVVVTAFAEQMEYLKAGKLRPLALIDTKGLTWEGIGSIPGLGEKYPSFNDLPPIVQWVGMGLPADMPDNIKEAYHKAWAYGLKSEALKKAAETTGFQILGYYGDQKTKDLAAGLDSVFSWTLYDKGLADKSPADFGIPKP